ncbi:hypothetical protein Sste5346_007130 [Sporothrix stenoceras]|uniref:Uncharacterized protein n=1 Tax=Sporothrix stenoceras TaxID=5173 RepID=A0ABR3YWV5_9PEZI
MAELLEPSPATAIPPTLEESRDFFLGLPSQPRLVARTNSVTNPYTRPLYRVLGPVTDKDLAQQWRAAVSSTDDNLNHQIHNSLTSQNVRWTTFVPLIVHGLPYDDLSRNPVTYPGPDPPKAEHALFLVIGVEAQTCSWAVGHAAANDCRRILQQQFPHHDIHALVAELAVVPMSSSPVPPLLASPQPAASPTPSPAASPAASPAPDTEPTTPVHSSSQGHHALFRGFDSTFDEIVTSDNMLLYKHYLLGVMQYINSYIVPFLPFPGQVIQPVLDGDNSERERPRGSLGLYIRLQSKEKNGSPRDTIYALTCRHVAIGRIVQEDQDYKAPQPTLPIVPMVYSDSASPMSQDQPLPIPVSNPISISMAWGSNTVASEQHKSLREQADSIDTWKLEKLWLKGEISPDGEEQLGVAKRCVKRYVPDMLDILKKEFGDVDEGGYGLGAGGRIFGHVELSRRMGYMNNGYLCDWALVAVHGVSTNSGGDDDDEADEAEKGNDPDTTDTDTDSRPHPTSTRLPQPLCPRFYSNHAYIGSSQLASDRKFSVTMRDLWNDKERRIAFQELLDRRDRASFVKLEAPSSSDSKTPLDPQFVFKNGGRTASTMGVTNPIEAVVRTPFSGREFPGARVLPILTMPPSRLIMEGKNAIISSHLFSEGGDSGAAVFDKTGKVVAMIDGGVKADDQPSNVNKNTDPDSLGASAKPEQSWTWTRNALGNWPAIDITYATPMEAIFDDIREVTGLDPVMV